MPKPKNKICLVSTSRADYGIMSNLIYKLQNDQNFQFNLFVTGSHLLKKSGFTLDEIKKNKIKIYKKINFVDKNSYQENICQILINFKKELRNLKPDMVIIFGDRYEMFASALTAFLENIPIAHIQGGEITTGSMDDTFRHSISKMAYLHFPSTSKSLKRLKQLGESKKKIYNVGSLSLEKIKKNKFFSKHFFEKKYNIIFNKKIILVVFHPNSLSHKSEIKYIKNIISSLSKIKGLSLIFTGSNIDLGGKKISNYFKKFTHKNKNKAIYVESFGREEFLSILKISDLIIGNSSSGIIEAPSLNTFTINIGDRQLGREKARSIFNCSYNKNNFTKLLKKISSIKKTKNYFSHNPYFKPNTSNKIISILKKPIKSNFNKKLFFDL